MRSGGGWVMLMMIGRLSVLRLRMMMVTVNDAGVLRMMMEEEIDVGLPMMMMMEEGIDVWRMRRMSGDGMRC